MKAFFEGMEKLKIAPLKIALTVHTVQCYFSKKGETKNHSVKNRGNGTLGSECYFPCKGENLKSASEK